MNLTSKIAALTILALSCSLDNAVQYSALAQEVGNALLGDDGIPAFVKRPARIADRTRQSKMSAEEKAAARQKLLETLPKRATLQKIDESTTNNVACQTFALPKDMKGLETDACFGPLELSWGDAGYFATFERNETGETFRLPGPFYEGYEHYELEKYLHFRKITITAEGIAGEYEHPVELATDFYFNASFTAGGKPVDYGAGTRRVALSVAVEFPPLEDSDATFWTAVREELKRRETVVLKLRVNMRCADNIDRQPCVYEAEITLKNRSNKELKQLADWRRSTPSSLFPKHAPYESFKTPTGLGDIFGNVLKSSGRSDIEIGGKSYDPWLFVRVGNRKPSDPNNPTTVDGWRRLEAEFAPSTLRDEITLTRLQIEYYDADEGEASDAALNSLVDWLSQRPEPQRVVLSQSLLSKRAKFKETPLEAKNATLCDALISAFPVEMPSTNDAK
ncbi:MAG: hypothetical protein J6K20_12740 [Thermoguttaceae bacterium]|nr:hypothetical protein [Thermoguttaceae bacterium]